MDGSRLVVGDVARIFQVNVAPSLGWFYDVSTDGTWFVSVWGIGFKQWQGAGVRAASLLGMALSLLLPSTAIVGYGN